MFRNKTNTFLIAFLIAAVFCIPFYQTSVFKGLDLTFHLSRIDGILSCTKDLQFPLSIYAEKNYGFGYASPLFYCDLFLFPASILYAMNIPLVIVYKIYVFAIVWIGAATSLNAMHYFTKRDTLVLFGALIFTFSSYHINDFFIRAALGEAMAFSLMPLFPVAAYRFFVEEKNNTLELAGFFTVLALSHLITFTMAAVVFAVLMICYIRTLFRNGHILSFIKAVIIGFCLSAFFLLPMVQQLRSQKFLFMQNRELFGETIMRDYSNTPLSVVSDYVLQMGYDLEAHHYFTGLVIVITPLLFLFVRKVNRKRHVFMAILTVISVLLLICTTDIIPLYKIQVLQSIQFTYRFNILIASFLPFVLVYALDHFKRKAANTVMTLLLIYTVVNTAVIDLWLIRNKDQLENFASKSQLFTGEFYENYNNWYNIAELSSGEYLPATHEMNYKDNQGSVYLFETTSPSVSYSRNGTTSVLRLESSSDGYAAIPVTWYLGYEAEVEENGSYKAIPITQEEYTGVIVIPIFSGNHTYRIRYIGTRIQKYALLVSFISLLILSGYLLVKKARETSTGEVIIE